jgi:hypothetical protein
MVAIEPKKDILVGPSYCWKITRNATKITRKITNNTDFHHGEEALSIYFLFFNGDYR